MDELEVCNNEIIIHIPLIVITTKISDQERIKDIEIGADAYLVKSFNNDELRT